MKSERRHELRENDLSHFLATARDYLSENGGRVGLAVFAVIAVIAIVSFAVRSRAAASEDVWRRKTQLSFEDPKASLESIPSLRTLADESSNRAFVLSCLMDWGQQALRMAREVPWPPDKQFNDLAEEAFRRMLSQFPDNPLARGVALSGLATVEENRFLLDGNLAHKDKAKEFLTEIINSPTLNGMPFQRLAIERRDALDETFVTIRFDNPPPPVPEPVDKLDDPNAPAVDRADDLPDEGVDEP